MKRIAVLTSLLALAACGGGSGGGGAGVPGDITRPSAPVDTVADSNSKITGMVSNSQTQVVTYVVGKLGTDAESVGLGDVSRSATHRAAFAPSAGTGDMNYDRAKELMELAQWLAKDDTSADDITEMFNNSKDDQNKIKSALKLLDDMWCYVGGDADETARRILERRAAFEKPAKEIKEKSEILTLDDVDLYTTPWSDTLTTLIFHVDADGRIESIEYPEATELLKNCEGCDITVGPMIRDGNTAYFINKDILSKEDMTDENPDGNVVSPDNVLGELVVKHKNEYISYAKDLGLKYSDFGVLETDFRNSTFNTEALTPEGQAELREFLNAWGVISSPFAGGYTDKQVSAERMTELAENGKITFTGLAVADVRVREEDAYNGNGIDIPLKAEGLRDNAATLVFDADGNQTLTADFSQDWYKIQVVKNADNTNSFYIIGGTGGDDERFHLDKDNPAKNIKDAADWNPHDMNDPYYDPHHTMVFKTGYYGDNGTPNEAVGLINYQYSPNDMVGIEDENGTHFESNPDGNIGVVIGFGGTKK